MKRCLASRPSLLLSLCSILVASMPGRASNKFTASCTGGTRLLGHHGSPKAAGILPQPQRWLFQLRANQGQDCTPKPRSSAACKTHNELSYPVTMALCSRGLCGGPAITKSFCLSPGPTIRIRIRAFVAIILPAPIVKTLTNL